MLSAPVLMYSDAEGNQVHALLEVTDGFGDVKVGKYGIEVNEEGGGRAVILTPSD
jgi:hypothetical protein